MLDPSILVYLAPFISKYNFIVRRISLDKTISAYLEHLPYSLAQLPREISSNPWPTVAQLFFPPWEIQLIGP